MYSMRFHDIVHTLETYGYRPQQLDSGVVLNVRNPAIIVDTLRLTQNARVETKGHYNTLIYSNGQRIAVDGDVGGVYLYELES